MSASRLGRVSRSATIILVALLSLFVWPALSHGQTSGEERIESFHSSIQINPDSSLVVTETILYDFGLAQKHGIYREIPQSFTDTDGNRHSLVFSLRSVADEQGISYRTDISSGDGKWRVRIGDPDVLVEGKHTYVISYSVQGAVSFLSATDELYWNVTGDEWTVSIAQASADVTLPSGAGLTDALAHCYRGERGSSAECQAKLGEESGRVMAQFDSRGSLAPGFGMTIAAGFPKGLVDKPGLFAPGGPLSSKIPLLPPALILLLSIAAGFLVWRAKGKDPEEGTVIAEYDAPPEITFLESAYLIAPSSQKLVAAGIIHLATLGAIRIEPVESKTLLVFSKTDYRLVRQTSAPALRDPLDVQLLDALFPSGAQEMLVADIQPTAFTVKMHQISAAAVRSLIDKGVYAKNFRTAPLILILPALALCALGAISLSFMWPLNLMFLGCFAGAAFLFILGLFMPKKTEMGAALHHKLRGLKLYVSVAEKDRLEFHNAPQKTPQLFEKLLPYAMLFGVVGIWTKEFEGVLRQPPGWYGDSSAAFNAAAFTTSMSSFGTSFASAVASSGAGGGGSSGGGGGGGGGGSW